MNDQGNNESKALEGLNDLQREAVLAGEGPVLVEAAVGSGKTRVLTRRLAWLLETGRAEPDRLLVLTFTNRAAREMKQRVHELLGPGAASVIRFFGTFHSVCRRLLNEELPLESYGLRPGFTITDEMERQALIGELAGALGEETGRRRIGELSRSIVRLKQAACGSFTFADTGEGLGDLPDSPLELELHKQYQERLARANACDFDDLILLPLRMLIDQTDVRKQLGARFDHVLVDEFQDTDRLQYLLLKGLLGPSQNLFLVGDPNQSIYTWRGACPEIFRRFREEYPGARTCTLSQHYRSSKTILGAAAGLARVGDGAGETEAPWTDNGDGPPLRLMACADERGQADLVAAEVQRLNSEEGVPFGSVAVLYRVNAQAAPVEAALRRDGVPVRVASSRPLTDLPAVRKLLGLWKALINPDDLISLRAAAGLPAWKLSPLMLSTLEKAGERHGLSLGQVLLSIDDLENLPARTLERARHFARALEELGAEATALAPTELFDLTVERSGFREEIRVHTAAGDDLWRRVLELRRRGEHLTGIDPWEAWPTFLAEVSLVSGAPGGEQTSVGQSVNLMTIHAAKGLEFEAVFIIGVNEGLLPLAGREEGSADFEEERRLLFVAMTRARQHLVLTHLLSVTRWGAAPWPSRFLHGLPGLPAESAGPASFLDTDGRNAVPVVEPEPPPSPPSLAPGDRVAHPRLGPGTVLEVGEGRIRIRFDESGEEKDLLTAFSTELKLIDG